jgi:hypothetical protein
MKRLPTPYEARGQECGAGWNALIKPLETEVLSMGGTVAQIKEKFGGLRFHYRLPRKVKAANRQAFQQRVEKAMEASIKICETCGAPGELINLKGALHTACLPCLNVKERSVRSFD